MPLGGECEFFLPSDGEQPARPGFSVAFNHAVRGNGPQRATDLGEEVGRGRQVPQHLAAYSRCHWIDLNMCVGVDVYFPWARLVVTLRGVSMHADGMYALRERPIHTSRAMLKRFCVLLYQVPAICIRTCIRKRGTRVRERSKRACKLGRGRERAVSRNCSAGCCSRDSLSNISNPIYLYTPVTSARRKTCRTKYLQGVSYL